MVSRVASSFLPFLCVPQSLKGFDVQATRARLGQDPSSIAPHKRRLDGGTALVRERPGLSKSAE
eukprot:4419305-Heterocapsa_arctica.AAC.1